jgi:hypothetical protein
MSPTKVVFHVTVLHCPLRLVVAPQVGAVRPHVREGGLPSQLSELVTNSHGLILPTSIDVKYTYVDIFKQVGLEDFLYIRPRRFVVNKHDDLVLFNCLEDEILGGGVKGHGIDGIAWKIVRVVETCDCVGRIISFHEILRIFVTK